LSKLAFLDRLIGQPSLKTNQLSAYIGTSPEGTAESSPGRTRIFLCSLVETRTLLRLSVRKPHTQICPVQSAGKSGVVLGLDESERPVPQGRLRMPQDVVLGEPRPHVNADWQSSRANPTLLETWFHTINSIWAGLLFAGKITHRQRSDHSEVTDKL